MQCACAQEVNRKTWLKTPVARRKEVLDMVLEHRVPLGPGIQEELVRARCQELSTDNLAEFLEVTLPILDGSPKSDFDPWRPLLRDTVMPDIQMCALMLKLIVHERVVPWISDDEGAAHLLLKFCAGLRKASAPELTEKAGAVVAASMKDLHDVTGYFVALLSVDDNALGTSVATLDEVKTGTGSKALVRAKLSQSKYWKKLEGKYRTAVVAHKVEGPVISKLMAGMQEWNMTSVQSTIEKLPGWRDRLRSVTVEPVEKRLQECFQNRLDSFSAALEKSDVGAEWSEHIQEFIKVARVADSQLRSAWEQQAKSIYSGWAEQAKAVLEKMEGLRASTQVKEAIQDLSPQDCQHTRPLRMLLPNETLPVVSILSWGFCPCCSFRRLVPKGLLFARG